MRSAWLWRIGKLIPGRPRAFTSPAARTWTSRASFQTGHTRELSDATDGGGDSQFSTNENTRSAQSTALEEPSPSQTSFASWQPTPPRAEISTLPNVSQRDLTRRRIRGAAAEPYFASDTLLMKWVQDLEVNSRLNGFGEIDKIWARIKKSGAFLPAYGHHAELLLEMLTSRAQLREEIFEHAKDLRRLTGTGYRSLYRLIAGRALEPQREQEQQEHRGFVEWHRLFAEQYWIPKHGLRSIARTAAQSSDGIDAFYHAYVSSKPEHRCVYDEFMPTAIQLFPEKAESWHDILIESNDFPSEYFMRDPAMRDFVASHSFPQLSSPAYPRLQSVSATATTSAAGIVVDKATAALDGATAPTQGVATRAVDVTSDTSPDPATTFDAAEFPAKNSFENVGGACKGTTFRGPRTIHDTDTRNVEQGLFVSDHTCAKLMATRMISLDNIIRALRKFRITTMGPLTLLELCRRAEDLQTARENLNKFHRAGILPDPSFICRALVKVIDENNPKVLETLLRSEENHNDLADERIQMARLKAFIGRDDYQSAEKVLQILTVLHYQPEMKSWNILLSAYAELGDFTSVERVFNDMIVNGANITWPTALAVGRFCLPERRRGKKEAFDEYSNVWTNKQRMDLVARAYLKAAQSAPYMGVERWRELIKRYGMTGYLSNVEALCFGILRLEAHLWAQRRKSRLKVIAAAGRGHLIGSGLPYHRYNFAARRQLRIRSYISSKLIFTDNLISAIIHWGFIHGFRKIADKWHSFLKNPENANRPEYSLKKDFRHSLPSHDTSYLAGIAIAQGLGQRSRAFSQHRLRPLVRRVIRQRVRTLCLPGRRSSRLWNRLAKRANPYTFYEIVTAVRGAWTGDVALFPELDEPIRAYEEALRQHEVSEEVVFDGQQLPDEVLEKRRDLAQAFLGRPRVRMERVAEVTQRVELDGTEKVQGHGANGYSQEVPSSYIGDNSR